MVALSGPLGERMAISDFHAEEAHAETVEREWTTTDRVVWSLVAGIAIYAAFYGFVEFMNFALGGAA